VTQVIIDEAARTMRAIGHAGDRDICIAVTWSLRTLAHCLNGIDALEDVAQDEKIPEFAIQWNASGDVLARSVISLLDRFARENPARMDVTYAVRHDREPVRQSA
jgi:hypothetical protein